MPNQQQPLIDTLIVSPGGTGRKEIPVADLMGEIPDLWHVAQYLRGEAATAKTPAAAISLKRAADQVLDIWHLAHAMRSALLGDTTFFTPRKEG